MFDNGAAHTIATCLLGGMNRLQLEMSVVQLLDGSDAKESTPVPEAEEGDFGVEEAVEIQGVHVVRGSHPSGEFEMTFEECDHIGVARVLVGHFPIGHCEIIREWQRAFILTAVDMSALMMPVNFGLFLQPFHHPSEDPTAALERDLELIVLLDELGYSDAWIGEHHSTGWENIGAPEVFIASAAERTNQIRFGTGVVQAGLHHPLVAMDRMILLDHLTRGRTTFGLGVGGGIPSDLTVFGLTSEGAADRMQESLDIMLRLLEGNEPVTAETDWFTINDAVLQMRPYTQPHMPFAVASGDRRNVTLMGKLGGTVLLGGTPERVEQVFADLAGGAAAAGKEASRDQIMLSYVMHLDESHDKAVSDFEEGAIREFYEFQVGVNGRPEPEDGPAAWYEAYRERNIIGGPEHAIERIGQIDETAGGLGGIIFMSREWAGIEASRDSWRLFAERVAPKFS
jgi:limonene 1,2-monooxygenase